MTDMMQRAAVPVADFDEFYAAVRGPLFRALCLALNDRDLATEAIDEALARAHQHWRKVRGVADPAAWTLAAALVWSGKRDRSGAGTHGFRLEREDLERDLPAMDAVNGLTPSYRAALVVRHYLEWPGESAATALGVRPDQVEGRFDRSLETAAAALGVPAVVAAGRISEAFAVEADRFAVPLSRLESAKGKSWMRRIGVAAASAAGVLVLVGGVALGVGALTNDDESPEVTETGPRTFAEIGSIADFEWQRIPLGGSGEISYVARGPAGFLTLGQDWSGPGRSLAWRSPDGTQWEDAVSPLQGTTNGYVQNLSGSDFGYIATGSRWDEFGGGGETILVWTSADGETWTESQLVESGSGDKQIGGMWVYTYAYPQIALAGPEGFLVVMEQNTDFDPSPLFDEMDLPAGVNPWDWGYGVSGGVLEIYGQNGVVFSATLEELGVDPEIVAMLGNRRTAFTSTDGIEWSETDFAATFGRNTWISSAAAGPGGFLFAVDTGGFGPVTHKSLWFSADGTTWDEVDLGERAAITAVSAFGDRFLVFGSAGGAKMWSSTDGTSWTATETDLVGSYYGVATGPLGIVAFGDANAVAGAGPAILEKDGWTIEMAEDGSYTLRDESGEVAYVLYSEDLVYRSGGGAFEEFRSDVAVTTAPATDAAGAADGVSETTVVIAADEPATTLAPALPTEPDIGWGPAEIDFVDPDTGEVIVTVTEDEIYRAWEQVWMVAEPRFEQNGYVLYHSVDGDVWSSTMLADSIGQGFYPNSLAVGDSAVVLVGWQDQGFVGEFFEGQPTPFVWVGTPPAG